MEQPGFVQLRATNAPAFPIPDSMPGVGGQFNREDQHNDWNEREQAAYTGCSGYKTGGNEEADNQ